MIFRKIYLKLVILIILDRALCRRQEYISW